MIFVLFGVTLLIFAISMTFSPLERATLYVNNPRQLRDLREIAERYHLYDPPLTQYVNWMKNVLRGDLGWSQIAMMPVSQAIVQFIPATAELVLYSFPLIFRVGIWLGEKSAIKQNKFTDHLTRLLAIIGSAFPTFWSAILLLSLLYGQLQWFPPGRLGEKANWYVIHSNNFIRYTRLNSIDALLNGEFWIFVDAIRHLILPVFNLVIVSIAFIMRVMRSSMLETLAKGYITTARAKGLNEDEVISKHARRNALIPVITITGPIFAYMISGLVITETVFAVQGIGYWAAKATISLDIASILGFSLFTSVIFALSNLIVDFLYAYVDPRIVLG